MEKLVKLEGHASRLASMRASLKRALKEVKESYRLACNTALCCEVTMQDLVSEIEGNIAIIDMHLKQGLLEGDIIEKKKKGA